MSRIGNKPVAIPAGVTVEVSPSTLQHAQGRPEDTRRATGSRSGPEGPSRSEPDGSSEPKAGPRTAGQGETVKVRGPKGELCLKVLPEVAIAVKDGTVIVSRRDDSAEARARHGLTRALLANMVLGVSQGYEKRLEVIGVGFKAQAKGKSVTLQLGFSHPTEYTAPTGVEIQNDAENKQLLIIRGADKQLVGQAAADIRNLRPPEPYKGKGIRYTDEYVRRKVGKAAVKTTT